MLRIGRPAFALALRTTRWSRFLGAWLENQRPTLAAWPTSVVHGWMGESFLRKTLPPAGSRSGSQENPIGGDRANCYPRGAVSLGHANGPNRRHEERTKAPREAECRFLTGRRSPQWSVACCWCRQRFRWLLAAAKMRTAHHLHHRRPHPLRPHLHPVRRPRQSLGPHRSRRQRRHPVPRLHQALRQRPDLDQPPHPDQRQRPAQHRRRAPRLDPHPPQRRPPHP